MNSPAWPLRLELHESIWVYLEVLYNGEDSGGILIDIDKCGIILDYLRNALHIYRMVLNLSIKWYITGLD